MLKWSISRVVDGHGPQRVTCFDREWSLFRFGAENEVDYLLMLLGTDTEYPTVNFGKKPPSVDEVFIAMKELLAMEVIEA
jgi:hypothetical protein